MKLYESKNWTVEFYENCQEFVGQCGIFSSKESLSDLTSEEWIELGSIEKELERVCKKLFDTTMFNFTCLMNNAYRDEEIPFVHFHFFPRYKVKINILGKDYADVHFGFNFWKWSNTEERQKDIFTQEERLKIFEMMKEEFNIKVGE